MVIYQSDFYTISKNKDKMSKSKVIYVHFYDRNMFIMILFTCGHAGHTPSSVWRAEHRRGTQTV